MVDRFQRVLSLQKTSTFYLVQMYSPEMEISLPFHVLLIFKRDPASSPFLPGEQKRKEPPGISPLLRGTVGFGFEYVVLLYVLLLSVHSASSPGVPLRKHRLVREEKLQLRCHLSG